MTGFVTSIDARALVQRMNDLEKRQFPFALAQTLNDAGFDVKNAWRDEMPRVFDNPTSWTLNAPLIRKATKQDPAVEVFLRNEIGDAIPPAQYLQYEVRGGARRAKRSEVLLRSAGVLGPSELTVPARGAPLDAFGNLPGGIITAVLADLQATFDEKDRSTRESRAKRSRRRNISKRAVYFYNREQRGKLPRGIYERRSTGFGSSLRGILTIVQSATYEPIYDVFALARRVFNQSFVRRWQDNLNKAVAGLPRTFGRQ